METFQPVDAIFHSGRVVTTSSGRGRLSFEIDEALSVVNGRIWRTGTNEEVFRDQSDATELIDLGGNTVLPGLIDTHVHLAHYGTNLMRVDCRPSATANNAQIVSAVSKKAATLQPGEWIVGWGWDESRMTDGRAPTVHDLDTAAPNNPVCLFRTCGHMAVYNSKALQSSNITKESSPVPGGKIVRDANGELTGLLQERALDLVELPSVDEDAVGHGLRLAQEEFLSRGITTIHDMSTQSTELKALLKLKENGLKIRVRPWLWEVDGNGLKGHLDSAIDLGIVSGYGDDFVRIQGVKFMLDGSVGGRTAAVSEPYESTQNNGILIADEASVIPHLEKALKSGLRAAIHGIGDRAVSTAVQSLKSVSEKVPNILSMRNRVEHCGLPSDDDLRDMKELGLVAASSVGFLYELGDSYLSGLGKERMARVYPQRAFFDQGIPAPPNSDCPVTDPNPWHVMFAAVTRTSISGQKLDSTQNITMAEALHGYTEQAAFASHEEAVLGSLKHGMHADFVVIDTHMDDTPEKIRDTKVLQTYVQGDLVYTSVE